MLIIVHQFRNRPIRLSVVVVVQRINAGTHAEHMPAEYEPHVRVGFDDLFKERLSVDPKAPVGLQVVMCQ